MPVVTGGTLLNMADWAKRMDPNGDTATIVELLLQTNDILLDMPMMESNGPVSHRTTVRTGLPTPVWRRLNGGVQPSKSTTAQLDETIGMLEDYCEIDKALADLNGNTAEFRLTEAQATMEALNQSVAQTLFYGDTAVNPERFLGLAPRFSTISGANNGQNIISGAGSGSVNTSVWLVIWGANSVHGIFPKGSKAGITHLDKGVVTVEQVAGIGQSRMEAYREWWQWKVGIALRDWRYVVRVCNIDTTNLVNDSGSQADLLKLMNRTLDRVPSFYGKAAFYANRTVRSMLRVQALDKSQNAISAEDALDQFGNPIRGSMKFMGIPVRLCDMILNTEATIS
jgi:hypothetical protein